MQISPEDIQWVDEDPGISHRGNYGGSGHGINRSMGRDGGPGPGPGRGRGVTKGQSRKELLPSQNGIGKKVPDDIQILHTDSLIREVCETMLMDTRNSKSVTFPTGYLICSKFEQVERVFNANHPDPLEIEKAKKVLKVRQKAWWILVCSLFLLHISQHIYLFCISEWLIFSKQDHEQALVDAISRLADISDGESGMYHSILYLSLDFASCQSF